MMTARQKYLTIAGVALAVSALALFVTNPGSDAEFYLQNTDGRGIHFRVSERNVTELPVNALQKHIGNWAGLKIPAPDGVRTNAGDISITLRGKTRLRDEKLSKAIDRSNLAGDSADGMFEIYQGKDGNIVHEFLLPKELAGRERKSVTILDCGPYTDAERTRSLWPSCQASVVDDDRFDVLYYVPRDSLSDWRAIEVDVLAFVQAIVVDCFDAELLARDVADMRFRDCGSEPRP